MNELVSTLVSEFADREYAHAYLQENSNLRIAAQVRTLRLQRGWSQEDLADRSAMRQERISKIESADFDSLTLTTLRRLAEAFDVHLSAEFIEVTEAIGDFVSLSTARLECDDRETSLARSAADLPAAYTYVQATTTPQPVAIPTGATLSTFNRISVPV